MKFTIWPKTVVEKVIVLFFAAVILSILYQDERLIEFDLHSIRVRHEHKICGFLISEEIDETELSKMLTAAGIVSDEPPRWVMDSRTTRGLFHVRGYVHRRHGVGHIAGSVVTAFQWMDEEYQSTGDEKFFVPEDMKKRVLLYIMTCLEEYPLFPEPAGDFPCCGPMKEVVEFMNRFREPEPQSEHVEGDKKTIDSGEK